MKIWLQNNRLLGKLSNNEKDIPLINHRNSYGWFANILLIFPPKWLPYNQSTLFQGVIFYLIIFIL
ncbi:MAG TPA: hypothetical protein VF610_03955 [Segetibacter sp.]